MPRNESRILGVYVQYSFPHDAGLGGAMNGADNKFTHLTFELAKQSWNRGLCNCINYFESGQTFWLHLHLLAMHVLGEGLLYRRNGRYCGCRPHKVVWDKVFDRSATASLNHLVQVKAWTYNVRFSCPRGSHVLQSMWRI